MGISFLGIDMNCPVCNQPMRTRIRETYTSINDKRRYYKYTEMICDEHPGQTWQTGKQLDDNIKTLQAIGKERKEATK